MIEKLDKHLASNINSCNMSQNIMVAHTAIKKINELVDAVNKLQHDNSEKANCQENVPDLDIQLSWIGYLCRFWDNNKIESTYAILDDINVWCEHPYRKSSGNQYKHCEPVKPDDNIIYKGE